MSKDRDIRLKGLIELELGHEKWILVYHDEDDCNRVIVPAGWQTNGVARILRRAAKSIVTGTPEIR